jgi:cytochrome b subunit of formate dehydrogenase
MLATVATVHVLSMLTLTVLLVGHLYFTFVYGALPGITTGYISEEAARLEHPKWVEEVLAEEAASHTHSGAPTTIASAELPANPAGEGAGQVE